MEKERNLDRICVWLPSETRTLSSLNVTSDCQLFDSTLQCFGIALVNSAETFSLIESL